MNILRYARNRVAIRKIFCTRIAYHVKVNETALARQLEPRKIPHNNAKAHIHSNNEAALQCKKVSELINLIDFMDELRTFSDETVIRGCIKDLSANEYELCKKEPNECHLCIENSCNANQAGSSNRLKVNKILIALFITFSVFLKMH